MMFITMKNLSLTIIGSYLLLVYTVLTTTTEEAPVANKSYDQKTLGVPCSEDEDCNSIKNAVCNTINSSCVCDSTHPIEGSTVCYKIAALNQTCVIDLQCEATTPYSSCIKWACHCGDGYYTKSATNGTLFCMAERPHPGMVVDYTMLGILVGMAAMFIVMCVVLRMFSKARFQEQRTIFNSPRLLKISLARKSREDSERRGSRCSVASRPPSVYSGLNVPGKSPTGSQASITDSRRGSNAGSRCGSVQTPLNNRRFPARNVDNVTVDIRGGKENSGPKVNKV
ncbi:hypothetical protein CHUAL_000752 [Chamberlinius hualienensis]